MAEQLVITRVLHAPRDLVFKVWSAVEHLKKWWGPTALTIDYAKLDFKPDGKFYYKMVSPEGDELWADSYLAKSLRRRKSYLSIRSRIKKAMLFVRRLMKRSL